MLERDGVAVGLMVTPDGNPAAEGVSPMHGEQASTPHPKEDQMATKAELIDAVADAAGVSKADAERTLGAFFDHVVSADQEG